MRQNSQQQILKLYFEDKSYFNNLSRKEIEIDYSLKQSKPWAIINVLVLTIKQLYAYKNSKNI